MSQDMLVPKRKFLRLIDYVERVHLDSASVLDAAGLTRAELESSPAQTGLPGKIYGRMYKDAVRQMQTLKRPIPWAAGIGSEAFDLMCHAMISAKTLEAALGVAQRFDALLYPMIGHRMELTKAAETFSLEYKVGSSVGEGVLAPEGWDRTEYTETVAKASGLMVWFALCGWFIGRSIDLVRVEVGAPYVSDKYRDGLMKVFNCPMDFDTEYNRLIIPIEYHDYRLVHTPESLDTFLDNSVFELISLASKPSSTTAAIRSLISLEFSGGMPSFEQMAQNLHMSESTLRRRLTSENTSYQNIKDQVRCELAIQQLRDSNTKVVDLAEELGFTEPSSFVRSFRAWTGMTPKAYRDGLAR
jgi:AraC-like DNA-binding protein